MSEKRPPGSIITFYSFKGGVGRSMAVANVGRLLARERFPDWPPVLLIDWDLEAPGLHRYFESLRTGRGLIEYFSTLDDKLRSDESFRTAMKSPGRATALHQALPIADYMTETFAPGLFLMPAGKFDSKYANSVATFSWSGFFDRFPYAIDAFRELLAELYSYVLVDSRTGITDISGMCTALLPDKLVALFVSNSQNRDPLLEVVEAAVEYRRLSVDSRPLVVFPVASRFDPNDLEGFERTLNEFQPEFENLFRKLYGLKVCDLSGYFREVILLYVSHYSYGEPNAVALNEPNYPGSLRRAYAELVRWLIREEPPWIEPPV